MAKLPSFRDTETMKRGSKSTSMKGAYVHAQIRPDTIKHKAALNSETAGQISTTDAADAAKSKSMVGMSIFNAAVDIGDAYLKIRRADEEASAEAGYMEYRETMSQYNADKMVNSKMFNEETGKFGWETFEEEHVAFGKKTRDAIEKKYKIKTKDILAGFDKSVRTTNLSQIDVIQQYQVRKLTERTTANWNVMLAKANTMNEYTKAVEFGLRNGQYAGGRAEADEALFSQNKVFNARSTMDAIDNLPPAHSSAILREATSNPTLFAEKYGKLSGAIHKASLNRVKDGVRARIAKLAGDDNSVESMQKDFNTLKAMSLEEVGASTFGERNQILDAALDEITRATKIIGGAKKTTAKVKAKAKKIGAFENIHYAKNFPTIRQPGDFVVDENNNPVAGLVHTGRNNQNDPELFRSRYANTQDVLTDPVTGESMSAISEFFGSPLRDLATVPMNDAIIDGANESFIENYGIDVPDGNGGSIKVIDMSNVRVNEASKSYQRTTGEIPKPAVESIDRKINSTNKTESAAGIMMAVDQIDERDDMAGMSQFSADAQAKIALGFSSKNNTGGLISQLAELEKFQTIDPTVRKSRGDSYDLQTKGVGSKRENNSIPEALTEALSNAGIKLPPSLEMKEYLDTRGRYRYQEKGMWQVAAPSAVADTLGMFAVEKDQFGEDRWVKNSIYAHSGVKGDNPFVYDQIKQSVVEQGGNPLESFTANGGKFITEAYGYNDNGEKQWRVYADGNLMVSDRGIPITLSKSQFSPLYDNTVNKQQKEKNAGKVATKADQYDERYDNEYGFWAGNSLTQVLTTQVMDAFRGVKGTPNAKELISSAEFVARSLGYSGRKIKSIVKSAFKGIEVKEFSENQMIRIANEITGSFGEKDNTDWFSQPIDARKRLGLTFMRIKREKMGKMLKEGKMVQEEYDDAIATFETVITDRGGIIPE